MEDCIQQPPANAKLAEMLRKLADAVSKSDPQNVDYVFRMTPLGLTVKPVGMKYDIHVSVLDPRAVPIDVDSTEAGGRKAIELRSSK